MEGSLLGSAWGRGRWTGVDEKHRGWTGGLGNPSRRGSRDPALILKPVPLSIPKIAFPIVFNQSPPPFLSSFCVQTSSEIRNLEAENRTDCCGWSKLSLVNFWFRFSHQSWDSRIGDRREEGGKRNYLVGERTRRRTIGQWPFAGKKISAPIASKLLVSRNGRLNFGSKKISSRGFRSQGFVRREILR